MRSLLEGLFELSGIFRIAFTTPNVSVKFSSSGFGFERIKFPQNLKASFFDLRKSASGNVIFDFLCQVCIRQGTHPCPCIPCLAQALPCPCHALPNNLKKKFYTCKRFSQLRFEIAIFYVFFFIQQSQSFI